MSRHTFFKLTSSLLDVKKKLKQINRTQVFNCGPKRPRRPPPKIYILEIPWGTPPRKSGRSRGTGVLIFLLTVFSSSKFLIFPTSLLRRGSPPKIAATWRYRLQINNLTAHYNSLFSVSFYLCF